MEQYFMFPRLKQSLSTNLQPSTNYNLYGDSWEEQAFADDAAGVLGGCVWPPRSYSCSFCRREFRSAQALGGHMNVHRRDRARLNMSPDVTHGHGDLIHQNHQNPIPNTIPSWDAQYPSRIHTMVYKPNQNSDQVCLTPSSIISRVSPPKQENHREKSFLSPLPYPILKEHDKKPSTYSPLSCTKSVGNKYSCAPETNDREKSIIFSSNRSKEDYMRDFSISLNLVVHGTRLTSSGAMEEEAIISKRSRIDSITFPFFPKSSSVDSHEHVQSEVVEGSSSSEEELDLELRLG